MSAVSSISRHAPQRNQMSSELHRNSSSNAMKILQVCNTSFYKRGFLEPLMNELETAGYSVSTAYPGEAKGRLYSGMHHDVAFPSSANPVGFIKSIVSLVSIIRRQDYQIVNSHNRNASIATRLACWLCGVSCNIYTAHGYYFHDNQSRWQYALTLQLEKWLARITTATLSQSSEDVKVAKQKFLSAKHPIYWIGNGIDTNRFKRNPDSPVRDELALPPDTFVITTVGRIVEGKGFQDLIQAFLQFRRKIPNSKLMIVGGNIAEDIQPYQEQIKKLIKHADAVEDIIFTGMVSNVEDYLNASSVYVLPSYREGISRAMLEAMSCSLPLIATRIRGCRETIAHGVNGLMYTPKDVDELTGMLLELASDPEKMSSMGDAGRATVEKMYDETDYIRRQMDCIAEIVSRFVDADTSASHSS